MARNETSDVKSPTHLRFERRSSNGWTSIEQAAWIEPALFEPTTNIEPVSYALALFCLHIEACAYSHVRLWVINYDTFINENAVLPKVITAMHADKNVL